MNKLFIVISIHLIAAFAVHAADDAGWNKVQWGMTSEQIAQAYPEAHAPAKPEDFKLLGEIFRAPLCIESFDLAGSAYKVSFLMDAKNTLAGVILARNGKSNLSSDANTLEKLLTQKYGPPSDVKDTESAHSIIWSRQGVTITLNNIAMPTISSYSVRLIYLRPNTAALDNL